MLKKILFYFFICSSLKALDNNKNYNDFLFTHTALYKVSSTYRHIWESLQEKPDLDAIYANLPEFKTEYISVLITNGLKNEDLEVFNTIIKELANYLLKERMKNISLAYEKARGSEGIYEKNEQGRWVKLN